MTMPGMSAGYGTRTSLKAVVPPVEDPMAITLSCPLIPVSEAAAGRMASALNFLQEL